MKFYRKICDILYWNQVTVQDTSFHVRLFLFLLYLSALCGYIVIFDIDCLRFIRKKKQLLLSCFQNKFQFIFYQIKNLLLSFTVSLFFKTLHFTPSSEDNHLNPALRF